jgi:hypothetical protein
MHLTLRHALGHDPIRAARAKEKTGMTTRLQTLLAVGLALTLAVAVAPAVADKGGNGGGKGNGGSGDSATVPSTITLDQAGQTLTLGDSVTFTTSAVGLRGTEYPMVYVECSSDADGTPVYGQLDYPNAVFVLGGGSSQWWLVGGSAECRAHLYSYGGKTQGGYDEIRELAEPISFPANG